MRKKLWKGTKANVEEEGEEAGEERRSQRI